MVMPHESIYAGGINSEEGEDCSLCRKSDGNSFMSIFDLEYNPVSPGKQSKLNELKFE